LSEYKNSICHLLSKWELEKEVMNNKPQTSNATPTKNAKIIIEDLDPASMFVLRRRIFHTACRLPEEIANLSSKCIKQLYAQCVKDYINLGVLNIMPRIEDVCKMAAYILHYASRSKKALRDGELKKEILTKYFDKAIPSGLRNEYNIDQWYQQISAFYSANGIHELDSDDCKKAFLSIYCKYPIAMSSYYTASVADAMSSLRIPTKSFCAVNMSGVHFMNEVGRKEIVCTIKYEDIISIAGYHKDFRLVAKDPNLEHKVIDLKLKMDRARELAEDIITYGQVNLIEKRYCSWVRIIDYKKAMLKAANNSKESGDNLSGDGRSEHRGLRSAYNAALSEAYGLEEDRKEAMMLTNEDLEKYYKLGIKQYELKTGFLMYEQAFPLHVPLEVIGTMRVKKDKPAPINIVEQPIIEEVEGEENLASPIPSSKSKGKEFKIPTVEPPAKVEPTIQPPNIDIPVPPNLEIELPPDENAGQNNNNSKSKENLNASNEEKGEVIKMDLEENNENPIPPIIDEQEKIDEEQRLENLSAIMKVNQSLMSKTDDEIDVSMLAGELRQPQISDRDKEAKENKEESKFTLSPPDGSHPSNKNARTSHKKQESGMSNSLPVSDPNRKQFIFGEENANEERKKGNYTNQSIHIVEEEKVEDLKDNDEINLHLSPINNGQEQNNNIEIRIIPEENKKNEDDESPIRRDVQLSMSIDHKKLAERAMQEVGHDSIRVKEDISNAIANAMSSFPISLEDESHEENAYDRDPFPNK